MRPIFQTSCSKEWKLLEELPSKYLEKIEGGNGTAMGMWLKTRCQVRADNIIDPSLDFVGYPDQYNKRTRPGIAAICNSQMNIRYF